MHRRERTYFIDSYNYWMKNLNTLFINRGHALFNGTIWCVVSYSFMIKNGFRNSNVDVVDIKNWKNAMFLVVKTDTAYVCTFD